MLDGLGSALDMRCWWARVLTPEPKVQVFDSSL